MPHRDAIWKQILAGKRSWRAAEFEGDPDVFFAHVVAPLRKLRDARWIESLHEIRVTPEGRGYIGLIEIVGAIHLDR